MDDDINTTWIPELQLTISTGCSNISRITWNGRNRTACSGREPKVSLHDFDDDVNAMIQLPSGYQISDLKFSPGEDILYVSGLNGTVNVYKLESCFTNKRDAVASQKHLNAHNAPIFSIDIDQQSKQILTAGSDKTIKLWSACGHKLKRTFRKHTNKVRQTLFSRDCNIFSSCGDDREVLEWDTRCAEPIRILPHVGGGASCISYLPDGHIVVAGRDYFVRVFDRRTHSCLCSLNPHASTINAVNVHSSGQFIATSCETEQCVSFTDLCQGRVLSTITAKVPVKNSLFLTSCEDIEPNDRTDNLLCLPGRQRKLMFYRFDLENLIQEVENEEVDALNSSIRSDNVINKRVTMARKSIAACKLQVPESDTLSTDDDDVESQLDDTLTSASALALKTKINNDENMEPSNNKNEDFAAMIKAMEDRLNIRLDQIERKIDSILNKA